MNRKTGEVRWGGHVKSSTQRHRVSEPQAKTSTSRAAVTSRAAEANPAKGNSPDKTSADEWGRCSRTFERRPTPASTAAATAAAKTVEPSPKCGHRSHISSIFSSTPRAHHVHIREKSRNPIDGLSSDAPGKATGCVMGGRKNISSKSNTVRPCQKRTRPTKEEAQKITRRATDHLLGTFLNTTINQEDRQCRKKPQYASNNE